MDKYTVDLDKVLNDFEYSELTDTFSTSRGYVPQSSSNYASSSKSKTGEAKHSITNVFHSLNEYLNTDISTPKASKDTDNNSELEKSENNYHPTNSQIGNLLDIENDCAAVVETFHFVDNKNFDTNLGSEELKIGDFEENPCSVDGKLIEVPKNIQNFEDVARSNQEMVDKSKIPETIDCLTVVETIEGTKTDIPETIEELTVGETIEALEETKTVEIPEKIEEMTVVDVLEETDDNQVETFEDAKEIIEDAKETKEKPQPNTDIPSDILVTEIIEENTIDKDKIEENPIKKPDKIQETIENTKTIEVLPEKQETTIEEPPDNLKPVKFVVSFNDTFDIDNSTLHQYLDDLEVELGSEEKVAEGPGAGDEEKSSEETVYEVALTESESVESPDVTTDENKGVVDVAEVVEGNIEDDDSISRPKKLELTASSSIDDSKREINLIGDPGSTPYNNIYVSKELQSEIKTDAQENPSENSSVSPTFSEASTETVTDSSESSDTDDPDIRTDASNKAKSVNAVKIEENACAGADSGDSLTAGNSNSSVEDVDVENNEETPTNEVAQAEAEVAFWLGKQAPLWIPDSDALACLHCDAKFTVIKRRHHCRACGLVLCSKCCNLKYRLDYLDAEARVCTKCHTILNRDTNSSSGSEISPYPGNSPFRQPNPNNPMEYCSVVPPMQQVGNINQNPPTVMVPVGVLKRKGALKKTNKSVMFCDGIRPGSDLTKLDTDFNYVPKTPGGNASVEEEPQKRVIPKPKYEVPVVDPETKSFLPKNGQDLPPIVTVFKSETTYICNKYSNNETLVDALKVEKLTFALYKNIYVHVKIVDMSCCINKKAWCFTTEGFLSVGQDEIVYLIEYIEDEGMLPMDIFHHLNLIYKDALKGTSVTELGLTLHDSSTFLDFKNHAGFLYIRPTFQCLQNIIKPTEPFLIGLLIHRWETPWAKIFPLRLVLRLGAEYRYYPSPIISTRHRDSVFVEIGHTIINLLADFRNFSYTLPSIRGLTIHMEEKNTTVTIPKNRYDQVIKSINNSSDHILALGGNFSMQADSHLVCIQDTNSASENSYSTHAINIQNRPRKVTGASFIVFNGALKSTSGLTAKSSIVEDGLMIQIPAEEMNHLREHMRNMKTYTIQCGVVNAPSDETVNIVWGDPDNNFNTGVTSPIDNQSLSGIPSIRVHNGKDFICNSGNRLIRWTEVFIIQNTDHESKTRDPVDISKISESISKATCQALVKYLDLLSTNNFSKIGLRTTLNVENVSYSAGSNNVKLPPIYMKSLDNELIPVLHRITSNNLNDVALTLELVFRILNT